MNLQDIKNRVQKIDAVKRDSEYAHGLEDALYEDLLISIARGECANPQECAAEALKTKQINFARCCA